MPIYEYKCENGHLFDIMQKMSEDSLTQCIECGASVKKVLHPVGISFKGSGFYSTDYSKKSSKEAPVSSSNGESKSDSKSDSKKESGTSEKSTNSSSEKSAKKD